ncbi:hypothetical protein ACJJTC_011138 [Scirpophaga incertulas]
MQQLNPEESYAERRVLFKNVWESAEIANKPKVIKTLKLDVIDSYCLKQKKLKLRKLRHVCNKLLDFYDKKDTAYLFHEQMNSECHKPDHYSTNTTWKNKKRKSKKPAPKHNDNQAAKKSTIVSDLKNETSPQIPKIKTTRIKAHHPKPTLQPKHTEDLSVSRKTRCELKNVKTKSRLK